MILVDLDNTLIYTDSTFYYSSPRPYIEPITDAEILTDLSFGGRVFLRPDFHHLLDIPITIAGMSFGSLSGPAKEALGRGATLAAELGGDGVVEESS